MKKVSVIIPAYNKAELTVKTVTSVLNQTYKNIEVIVVDDGSTDDTWKLLVPYANEIRYVYKKNAGACSARNLGIRLATGEYIAFLDCDDLYLPQKIEKSMDFLENNPDFGFIHTFAYLIDEKDTILPTSFDYRCLHTGWIAKRLIHEVNFICNSTQVVRRACFEKVGFFNEKIFIPADWDMWIRLAEQYKVGFIRLPLTYYRFFRNYTFRNLGQLKREILVVLENAFQRNPELNQRFKNKAISNAYYYQALCCLANSDLDKVKEELISSIQQYRFNLKALFMLLRILVLGKNAKIISKYLRSVTTLSRKLLNKIMVKSADVR